MRALLFAAVLFTSLSSSAQYYYKDIVGTRESSELVKTYRNNKVTKVTLTSYDESNTKSDDFFVEQQVSANSLRTVTQSEFGSMSVLTSFTNSQGLVTKTVDSNHIVQTTTDYTYNGSGQLISVSSSSVDSAGTSTQTEQHIWQWSNGHPARMLRIKNRTDTVFVDFKLDAQGNVIEERETHKKVRSEPVYYYYNDNNQLTDIVRFHPYANKLLPEYMFEYSASNQVIQKITVPSNSFDYLIWRYQYDSRGLKTKEAIYSRNDKTKQMGRIEYHYYFGS